MVPVRVVVLRIVLSFSFVAMFLSMGLRFVMMAIRMRVGPAMLVVLW